MTIMERLERQATTGTRPHLEWQWEDGLVVHAGSLRTKDQMARLIELLSYFEGKLPEVDPGPFEDAPKTRGKASP